MAGYKMYKKMFYSFRNTFTNKKTSIKNRKMIIRKPIFRCILIQNSESWIPLRGLAVYVKRLKRNTFEQ